MARYTLTIHTTTPNKIVTEKTVLSGKIQECDTLYQATIGRYCIDGFTMRHNERQNNQHKVIMSNNNTAVTILYDRVR